MTDNERRVAGFWALFGAVSLPFGGMLGGLLGDVGKRLVRSDGNITLWDASKFGVSVTGLMAFFAFVPLLCLAVVRRWERKGAARCGCVPSLPLIPSW